MVFLKESLSVTDWKASRAGPEIPDEARAAQRSLAAASLDKSWNSKKKKKKPGMRVCGSLHV